MRKTNQMCCCVGPKHMHHWKFNIHSSKRFMKTGRGITDIFLVQPRYNIHSQRILWSKVEHFCGCLYQNHNCIWLLIIRILSARSLAGKGTWSPSKGSSVQSPSWTQYLNLAGLFKDRGKACIWKTCLLLNYCATYASGCAAQRDCIPSRRTRKTFLSQRADTTLRRMFALLRIIVVTKKTSK